MGSMIWYEPIARILLALGTGSLIGIERQYYQRAAGLRTNALVATGSALFVMISMMTAGEGAPTRVAAQVASGIGFLGGGVILREGFTIRGLNTAATLWCAAAVGSLAGSGLYLVSLMGALAVVVANLGLRPLAMLINAQPDHATETDVSYECTIVGRAGEESVLRALLMEQLLNRSIGLHELATERTRDGSVCLRAVIYPHTGRDDSLIEKVIGGLVQNPAVDSAKWSIVNRQSDTF
jgi:putative Mg2+ transporter-C (MgtC) family protein